MVPLFTMRTVRGRQVCSNECIIGMLTLPGREICPERLLRVSVVPAWPHFETIRWRCTVRLLLREGGVYCELLYWRLRAMPGWHVLATWIALLSRLPIGEVQFLFRGVVLQILPVHAAGTTRFLFTRHWRLVCRVPSRQVQHRIWRHVLHCVLAQQQHAITGCRKQPELPMLGSVHGPRGRSMHNQVRK